MVGLRKGDIDMNLSLRECPVCSQPLAVTRYHCGACDTTIDGRFQAAAFPGLSADQMEFVRTFVRCEGKMNRMEVELGLSYPTIRNRLHEVIRSMGFEPRGDDRSKAETSRRLSILDDLDDGRISADEALQAIRK